jgi:hypothetical protein
MDALDHLFKTDKIDIFKQDGSLVKANVPAQVDRKTIVISDVSIPIECGYSIKRLLPAGIVEEYVVEDPGFDQGMHPMKPQYCVIVRRKDAISRPPTSISYHVTGVGARLNIGTYDSSHNVIFQQGSPTELFEQLRKVAAALPESDREAIFQSIGDMEDVQGKPTFLDRYTDFMALIASHVTVFAPMIPALTALLPHAK